MAKIKISQAHDVPHIQGAQHRIPGTSQKAAAAMRGNGAITSGNLQPRSPQAGGMTQHTAPFKHEPQAMPGLVPFGDTGTTGET